MYDDNEIPETNVSDNAQVLTIQAAESGFEAADAESNTLAARSSSIRNLNTES